MKPYFDFDITIARSNAGYQTAVRSVAEEAADAFFKVPFSDQEIELFLVKLGGRQLTRRVGPSGRKTAQAFGGRLFEALFTENIEKCFRSSLDHALRNDARLRIRLRLDDVPELADLPWEFLYHAAHNRFLALSSTTPIIRYLDVPETILPLRIQRPVRILAMISSPLEYAQLDVEKEFHNFRTALANLEKEGAVILERLDRPTLNSLQRQLRRNEYHIFHFIGHGVLDDQLQEGALLLETDNRRAQLEPASHLATVLHNARSLRLVVLNACEGARTTRSDPYSGIAQSLIQQGIPAVVAMQFEISDRGAIVFAQEFYNALADGLSVDIALTEARVRLFGENHELEWATPVLYTRSEDGRLFDVVAKPIPAIGSDDVMAEPVPAIGSDDVMAEPVPAIGGDDVMAEPAPADGSGGDPKRPRPWIWIALLILGCLAVFSIAYLTRQRGAEVVNPAPLEPSPVASAAPAPLATLIGETAESTPPSAATKLPGVTRTPSAMPPATPFPSASAKPLPANTALGGVETDKSEPASALIPSPVGGSTITPTPLAVAPAPTLRPTASAFPTSGSLTLTDTPRPPTERTAPATLTPKPKDPDQTKTSPPAQAPPAASPPEVAKDPMPNHKSNLDAKRASAALAILAKFVGDKPHPDTGAILVKIGSFEQAKAMAKLTKDSHWGKAMAVNIVKEQLNTGDISGALATARELGVENSAAYYVPLAAAYYRKGNTAEYQKLVDRAWSSESFVSELAVVQSQLGDRAGYDKTIALVAKKAEDTYLDPLLETLWLANDKERYYQRLDKIKEALAKAANHSEEYYYLVDKIAVAGDIEGAKKLLPVIKGHFYDDCVSVLGRALSLRGETDAAIALYGTIGKGDKVQSQKERSALLLSIPAKAIEGGHFEKARQAAAKLKSPPAVDIMLKASGGDLEALKELGGDGYSDEENLRWSLFIGFAKLGRFQEVEQVIPLCQNSDAALVAAKVIVGLPRFRSLR